MTKEDILDFLNTLRKPSHLDPTHKFYVIYAGNNKNNGFESLNICIEFLLIVSQ